MSWILDEEVLAVIAAVVIVASVFAVAQFINSGRVTEPFSALGILGPNMKIGDYPREVVAGSPFRLYLYLENHEGKSVYYRILIKLGNKTSTINETTPLNSTPIMEIRRVLVHNSTWIYPLDITLYTPGDNERLVIEMWIYNETTKSFTYYGRWNQLWLNVTSPSLGIVGSKKFQEIPSELDNLLTEGFLAVRKAESSGGNVSEMVFLLNEAIDHAQRGDYAKVISLVNQTISLEPEVSKLGIENKNKQLILSAVAVGVVFVGGAGSYLYLRKEFWVLWSKLKSKYTIKLNSRIKSENLVQERIQEVIRSNKGITVDELISSSSKLGIKSYELAKELFNMVKSKLVILEDPSPPESFSYYIFSTYSLEFWITLVLLSLTLLSVYFSSSSLVLYLRYVLGSLFVLFLPGYSLIEALYPREEELSPLERLALSIGLSLALVPLVGLVLNYTPWGIRLVPVVSSLTVLTFLLMLVASWRKYLYLRLLVEGKKSENKSTKARGLV
ncbi:MAG: DUF1616 domain-containing protein [Thermoproteota archaeon]